MADLIQLRRDTTEAWEAANPILADGEPGIDTTLDKIKYGDGLTHWNDLDFSATNGVTGFSSGSYNPLKSLGLKADCTIEKLFDVIATLLAEIQGGSAAPFTPNSIESAKVWLKAKSITATADNDLLAQWNNSLTNASVHATAGGTDRPTYKANGGQPYLDFDGANNHFSMGDNFDINNNSMSIFAVHKRDTAANMSLFAKSFAGSVNGRYALAFLGSGIIGGFFDAAASGGVSNNTAVSLESAFVLDEVHLDRTAGTLKFYRNTVLIDTKNFTPDPNNSVSNSEPLFIGGFASNSLNGYDGKIKEIFMTQGANVMTGSELTNLRAYFNTEHTLGL